MPVSVTSLGFIEQKQAAIPKKVPDPYVWAASLVTILSLFALFLTPILIESHTSSIRREIDDHVMPARDLVDELEVGVAREASAIRGYILNGSETFRTEFYQGEAEVNRVLERLDSLNQYLSQDVQESLEEFRREWESWRTPYVSLLDGALSREDAIAGLSSQRDRYEATVRAANKTARAIENLATVHRASIRSAESTGNVLMAILAILTLASAGAVMWFSARIRLLATQMEFRARREEALRLLAATLSAATTETEILSAVARNARWILGARSALAGPLGQDKAELTVVASAGIRCSAGSVMALEEVENVPVPIEITDDEDTFSTDIGYRRVRCAGRTLNLYSISDGETEWALGLGEGTYEVTPQLNASTQIVLDLMMLALKRRQLFVREHAARDAAEKAVRTRDEVLAIVSHDLKNPLTAISLSTGFLRRADAPAELREKQVSMVEQAVERMERLIKDLLDVARLQGGQKLNIVPKVVPASQFLLETQELHGLLARSKHIEFECWTDENLPEVMADHSRITQVISNLIGNAIKFTPEGGRVSFFARTDDHAVLFAVEDTGPGIHESDLNRIFDPYWQVARTARLGTGLGLPISKGIIEAHGGRIWVESLPGEGSTFYFSIPRAAQ